jgi:hypothetical protein
MHYDECMPDANPSCLEDSLEDSGFTTMKEPKRRFSNTDSGGLR